MTVSLLSTPPFIKQESPLIWETFLPQLLVLTEVTTQFNPPVCLYDEHVTQLRQSSPPVAGPRDPPMWGSSLELIQRHPGDSGEETRETDPESCHETCLYPWRKLTEEMEPRKEVESREEGCRFWVPSLTLGIQFFLQTWATQDSSRGWAFSPLVVQVGFLPLPHSGRC